MVRALEPLLHHHHHDQLKPLISRVQATSTTLCKIVFYLQISRPTLTASRKLNKVWDKCSLYRSFSLIGEPQLSLAAICMRITYSKRNLCLKHLRSGLRITLRPLEAVQYTAQDALVEPGSFIRPQILYNHTLNNFFFKY